MKLRSIIIAVAVSAAVFVAIPARHEDAQAAPGPACALQVAKPGDSGLVVARVQQLLSSNGWPVIVDGVFGKDTDRTVRLFQRANGLYVDGIVGKRTLAALGCEVAYGPLPKQPAAPPVPAVASAPAAPAAPKGGSCPQYEGLLAAAGLPVRYFSAVMWRESRCDAGEYNGKRNDRSYGLLQINTKGALWGELQWRCGLTAKEQLWDPGTNVQCAAALFRTYGYRPWRV